MRLLRLFLGAALLLVLGGCHRGPSPEKLPPPSSRSAKLPVAYDTLPRVFELYYSIGESTYCLLATPDPEKLMECALDSIFVFVSAPGDSLYRLIKVLGEAYGLCPSAGKLDEPAVLIEPIDRGRRHVLILYTWGGGNSTSSFGAFVWLFPECRLLLEAEGAPRLFRLTADSILALASYDVLWPPPSLEGIPNASLAYPVSNLSLLESGLSDDQVQRAWQDFLERSRQQALRQYEADPGLVWAAINYIIYSRLLGQTAEVQAFLRRVARDFRRRQWSDPAELEYIRFAARAPVEPSITTLDVILQSPHRLP
ncbi:hypothetical protein HRbin21_01394 [bacterium HR21]|nr:hypothetical protein HRbin21_01394 [bacterium HR21]